MVLENEVEETIYELLYKQTTDENHKNPSTVVEKFVILMRILGRKFGVNKLLIGKKVFERRPF